MHHDQRPAHELASATVRSRLSALRTELRSAMPARDGGWLESSWDLSHGLEISDLEGDLPVEFGSRTPPR